MCVSKVTHVCVCVPVCVCVLVRTFTCTDAVRSTRMGIRVGKVGKCGYL